MIAGIRHNFDDGPQGSVGADWESNLGWSSSDSALGRLAGTSVGDECDDEENCKEESSNHEHHEAKR